ncbi:MAG: DUF5320 domain-containing protein [Spirochaetales bacterium]|nr:DUF5320 domain-containing protein [Spirochaetales bacterium]
MPGFNGTGPFGKGPMTGNGKGFCILKANKENPENLEGYVGVQGHMYSGASMQEKVSIIDSDNFNKGGGIMPRGDGTGPVGSGPMTGRAAGYCSGNLVPGYMNPALGQGPGAYGFVGRGRGFFGQGRRRGRGMGFGIRGRIPHSGYSYTTRGIAP